MLNDCSSYLSEPFKDRPALNSRENLNFLPVAIDPQYSFVMKSIQFYKYSLIP